MYTHSYTDELDGKTIRLWSGHITKVATQIGLPAGTYRRTIDHLSYLNCIKQAERGYRGSQLTTFLLLRPPTTEVWEDAEILRNRDLTRQDGSAMLTLRVKSLEDRLEGVNVKQALVELQMQVDDLKKILSQKTQ